MLHAVRASSASRLLASVLLAQDSNSVTVSRLVDMMHNECCKHSGALSQRKPRNLDVSVCRLMA
jgi:hypothetical protein